MSNTNSTGDNRNKSKIVYCDCSHDFQDRRYGKGKRVANGTAKGKWRCTVCAKEH